MHLNLTASVSVWRPLIVVIKTSLAFSQVLPLVLWMRWRCPCSKACPYNQAVFSPATGNTVSNRPLQNLFVQKSFSSYIYCPRKENIAGRFYFSTFWPRLLQIHHHEFPVLCANLIIGLGVGIQLRGIFPGHCFHRAIYKRNIRVIFQRDKGFRWV